MFVQINGIEYDLVLKILQFIKGNNVYKEESLRLKKRFLIIKRFLKYDETKRTGPGITLRSCTRVTAEKDSILRTAGPLRREKGNNDGQ